MLLSRLLLDALEAFDSAIAHLSAPGRGGPLGPLNPSGWVVAHAAWMQDRWLDWCGAEGAPDAWCLEWFGQQGTRPDPVAVTRIDDATEAFHRVGARVTATLDRLEGDTLFEPARLDGTPWAGSGATVGYLIARSVAHLFVHAGELTVIASLAGEGDLGLPGPLPRSRAEVDPTDPSLPFVTALLRDAYVELGHTFEALPLPSAQGEIVKLNPGSYIVVHALSREDFLWNVTSRGVPFDPLIATLDRQAPARPFPLDDVRAAFDRVTGQAAAWLATLDGDRLAAAIALPGGESLVGAQVARSAAHVCSHAGELQAIASLSGAPDLSLPGALAHCLAVQR